MTRMKGKTTRGVAPGVEDGGGHVAALGVHEGELCPLEAPGVQRVEVVWGGTRVEVGR